MKKKYFYLYIFIFFFTLCFLIYIAFYDMHHNARQYQSATDVVTWTDYQVRHNLQNDSYTLTGTIHTTQSRGYVLAFYSVHQNFEVYADHTLIYQYPVVNDNPLAKTSGYNWNFIMLPSDHTEITMTITSPYKGYAESVPEFLVGNILSVTSAIIRENIASFLLCTIIFCIGICMIAYWIFIRIKVKIKKNLLQLGVFALLLAAWSINESRITTLILRNNIVCSYIAFLSLMLLPFSFAVFVRSFYENSSKAWDMFCIADVIQIMLCIVLQLFKIADFRETLWTTHFMMGVLTVLVFYYSIKQLRHGIHSKRVLIHLFCIFICILTLGLDLGAFYVGAWDSNGFGRIGFLFYVVVLGIASSKESATLMKLGKKANTYQHLAFTDHMTSLNNRTAFNRDFDKYFSNPTDVAIIEFDLNNLKKTNDTFGHSAGDKYITDAAQIIGNIFSGIGNCYRTGGDEFVVLLENASSIDITHYLAILEWSVDCYNRDSKEEFNMQIAYGTATYSEATDATLEDTYNRADNSMYENKKCKKGNR